MGFRVNVSTTVASVAVTFGTHVYVVLRRNNTILDYSVDCELTVDKWVSHETTADIRIPALKLPEPVVPAAAAVSGAAGPGALQSREPLLLTDPTPRPRG